MSSWIVIKDPTEVLTVYAFQGRGDRIVARHVSGKMLMFDNENSLTSGIQHGDFVKVVPIFEKENYIMTSPVEILAPTGERFGRRLANELAIGGHVVHEFMDRKGREVFGLPSTNPTTDKPTERPKLQGVSEHFQGYETKEPNKPGQLVCAYVTTVTGSGRPSRLGIPKALAHKFEKLIRRPVRVEVYEL